MVVHCELTKLKIVVVALVALVVDVVVLAEAAAAAAVTMTAAAAAATAGNSALNARIKRGDTNVSPRFFLSFFSANEAFNP